MNPLEPEKDHDPRIPVVGTVTAAERMFRMNWVAAELRSPSGVPLHPPDYVARLGHAARVIDVRRAEELTGPLGYVPGSDWIPEEEAFSTLSQLGKDEPIMLVSRGGERAGALAKRLEGAGFPFASSMMGGIIAWRQVGLSTIRDESITTRRGVLRAVGARWDAARRPLSADDIVRHVGDPRTVHRMKLAALLVSGRVSCVDGRDDSAVIGTPGGDAGEFLLALAALEQTTGARLDGPTLRALLLRRLDAFGHFYLHSDGHASTALIGVLRDDPRFASVVSRFDAPLQWRRFFSAPPSDLRAPLLELMTLPAHIGCGHLRLAVVQAAQYGVRAELVTGFLRRFYELRWEGVDENEVAVLPGGHAEGAVVNVLLDHEPDPFSRIPLVSPMAEGSQMFLQHPQVSRFLRAQLVRFMGRQRDIVRLADGGEPELERAIAQIATSQLDATLTALAPGLPVYDLVFAGDAVRVEARGTVPVNDQERRTSPAPTRG